MNRDCIYLDNHASTPVDPRVLQAMLPYFTDNPSNPSNPYHPLGRRSAEAVEEARHRVAQLIGADAEEVFFTSSATESNNLAILGLLRGLPDGAPRRVVSSAIEHKSVLACLEQVLREGAQTCVVRVDRKGHVDLNILEDVLKQPTALVAIQIANNEIGTIQHIGTISRIVHEAGALLHCDAAQAVGKIPVDVNELGIDLLSVSAHKMYGPKGVGALYVRRGLRRAISPLQYGGGQERDLRPGTLNVPAIVGFGEACRLCAEMMEHDAHATAEMRDCFEQWVMAEIPSIVRNGDLNSRLPNNSSLTIPGVDADALLLNLPDIALSTGSACTAGAMEPSHVLQAIGIPREEAYRTIRVGFGRFNTLQEAEYAAQRVVRVVHELCPALHG